MSSRPTSGACRARHGLHLALLLALSGCAGTPQPQRPAWRIEPVMAITHADGGSAGAHYLIGRQIESTRDWARAAEAYRQALQRDPAHVPARNALGVALARLGLLEEAEAQLRQAVAAAPQRGDLHSNLGYLLLLAGRPQEALPALEQALALDPQDRVAHANLRLLRPQVPRQPPPAVAPAVAAAPWTPMGNAAAGLFLQVSSAPTLPPLAAEGLAAMATLAAPAMVAPSAAALPVAGSLLEVSNGLGRPGVAAQLRRHLQRWGLEVQRAGNLPPYRQPYTVVLYRPGQQGAARRVSRALPLSVPLQEDAALQADVRVLIGHDWPAASQASGAGVAR